MLELIVQVVFVLALIPALLGAINLLLYRPIKKQAEAGLPKLSVLIPARNEEARITPVLQSVLACTGVDFEVIVADDSSTDQTARIVTDMAKADPRLKLITTRALPEGWLGKTNACHFLSTEAGNKHAVFLDADVTLEPDALSRIASEFARRPAVEASVGFSAPDHRQLLGKAAHTADPYRAAWLSAVSRREVHQFRDVCNCMRAAHCSTDGCLS